MKDLNLVKDVTVTVHAHDVRLLPQTNADRIRAMSDEELADEIVKCRDADDFRKTVLGMRMNTTEEWLSWLKSPAEGE